MTSIAPRHSAALRVLRALFGRYWFIYVPAVTAILFGPAVWYRAQIALDVAKFVEEWVKLGATTVLFFIVVEIFQERRRSADVAESAADFLYETITSPLSRTAESLVRLTQELKVGQHLDASAVLRPAGGVLAAVHIAATTPYALPPRIRGQLEEFAQKHDLDQISNVLSDLSETLSWDLVPLEDLRGSSERVAAAAADSARLAHERGNGGFE